MLCLPRTMSYEHRINFALDLCRTWLRHIVLKWDTFSQNKLNTQMLYVERISLNFKLKLWHPFLVILVVRWFSSASSGAFHAVQPRKDNLFLQDYSIAESEIVSENLCNFLTAFWMQHRKNDSSIDISLKKTGHCYHKWEGIVSPDKKSNDRPRVSRHKKIRRKNFRLTSGNDVRTYMWCLYKNYFILHVYLILHFSLYHTVSYIFLFIIRYLTFFSLSYLILHFSLYYTLSYIFL